MHKKTQEDRLLEARVNDAFESASRYRTKFIGFLDPYEAAQAQLFASELKKRYDGVTCDTFGGYEGAERVFLGVFPPYSEIIKSEFPIAAVKIKWRFAKLTHRDFLGAILALGIVRSKIGDIIVGDCECTVFVDKSVASFILQNLTKVGSAGVECSICEGDITRRSDNFKFISGTVASKRLDCVVSALTGRPRSVSAGLIAEGKVFVNYVVRDENSYEINEGAAVSIRGHGRFIIDKLGPQTKKGRLTFAARKFL
ncbi:YlmH/Sll1252 family protein [[Clostridium] cellulosi]